MKLRVPHTYVLLVGLIALAAVVDLDHPGRKLRPRHRQRAGGRRSPVLSFRRGPSGRARRVHPGLPAGPAGDRRDRLLHLHHRRRVRRPRPDRRHPGRRPRARAAGWGGTRPSSCRLLTIVFAVGGGTIGIAEETLVFLPALLLLARSLGYDSLVAGGIALVGANAGFAGAFMNPFTVGVAQGIVGLPLFSGMGFRLGLWTVMTAVTVVFLTRYARRVAAKPRTSLVYELDRAREPQADADKTRTVRPQAPGRARPGRRRPRPARGRRPSLAVGHPRAVRAFLRAGHRRRPARRAHLRRHRPGLRPGRRGHRLRRAHRRAGPGNARRPARRPRRRHHHPRPGRGAPGLAVRR